MEEEFIAAVAEFTVKIVVVENRVETLLDDMSEAAPNSAGTDDWLFGSPCVVVSPVVRETDPINTGYESIPSRIRANAIPNPAVAIGLSGNSKVLLLFAINLLIVLPFRTLVLP